MSSGNYRVSVVQSGDLKLKGYKLVHVDPDTYDVTLWPEGIGIGPSITFSKEAWSRIRYETQLAFSRADAVNRDRGADG